jgi:hypothetical protein
MGKFTMPGNILPVLLGKPTVKSSPEQKAAAKERMKMYGDKVKAKVFNQKQYEDDVTLAEMSSTNKRTDKYSKPYQVEKEARERRDSLNQNAENEYKAKAASTKQKNKMLAGGK